MLLMRMCEFGPVYDRKRWLRRSWSDSVEIFVPSSAVRDVSSILLTITEKLLYEYRSRAALNAHWQPRENFLLDATAASSGTGLVKLGMNVVIFLRQPIAITTVRILARVHVSLFTIMPYSPDGGCDLVLT